MSLDFDSGALQTQHDDEEEYDREDYARDQELKQLLTDLPHDMLEDSRDLSSPELNSSDCSANELHNGKHQPWQHETSWNEHQPGANPQEGYAGDHRETPYCEQYKHKNINEHGDNLGHLPNITTHTNGWSDHQSEDEDGSVYDINYSYPTRRNNEVPKSDTYHTVDDYEAEGHYQQSNIYHLPEDFQPYTNGHRQEFTKPQDGLSSFPDAQQEHFKRLTAPDITSSQPVESFQVKYNPYQLAMQRKAPFTQEDRSDERFEEMQKEFLNPGENSSDKMQIAQLQVLYKARGRQLEELQEKLEESGREMRYLNHQLAMIRAEKDGLAMSLQESQKLYQNGRDREVQFKGQIKALDANIQTLTANEEQMRKKFDVSEVALENMQQQLMDLRRSDSLKRAREQHEAVVTSLKQKSEEQLLLLQQKLDTANTALQEQKERCCCLEDHVKQLERKQEENKLEKNEIINRLTRSLEESQKQCANLLQTGTIQETTQLRFQLQQAQSSKMISDNMNKALQEELSELKEHVALYESAAKHGVYLNGTDGEAEVDLSESYVDLGIQNANWKKSRLHSVLRKKDLPVDLTKDEIIMELKVELERSLGSNKVKRHQVSQLQQNLKEYQVNIEELKKQLDKVERTARDYEVRTESMEKHMDTLRPYSSASSENLKEEIQKQKIENQALQQKVETHLCSVQELTLNEENLKIKNQDLCNEMRQMIEDFDCDKQEAIDRCERTYQQHHEDIKNHLHRELSEKYEAEKEQLRQMFEEQMSQIQAQLDQKDKEMTAVQECYITVCREKDSLEDTLKKNMSHELTATEEKLKEQLLKEKDETLRFLKEKHQSELASARNQWLRDKEADLKRAVEAQVVLARTHWKEEQRQLTEKAILATEKEWQRRLDKTAEELKKVTLVDCKDFGIQTEPNNTTDPCLSKEVVEELQLKLEKALQDKEKAVRQTVVDLEIRHRENVSCQVEASVNNAHIRWLKELTSLAEYKAALKAEQENWEKENERIVAKQIAAVLATAEEKWKRDNIKQPGSSEKPLINVKQKELEEKITSLTRELESKNEEHAAGVKAELATARTEWNKEKQEEINRIRGQNEKDYRNFLDDHRNKINEVLAQAKEDFERQKRELCLQNEIDIKEYLEQNRKEWVARENKKLQQHENEILGSLEYLLGKVHLELVKGTNDKCTLKDNPPSKTIMLSIQYQGKLMDCLRKACREIVCKCIENAKLEWKKKNEACTHDRRTVSKTYLQETKTSDSQDMSMETDQTCTKVSLDPQDYSCCEHGFQELEKSKSECRELKSKLEKACRHLQQAVKEQKAKGEQFKEINSFVEALKKENNELQKKLEEIKACVKTKNSLQLEGAGGNSCTFCCGKGLEEMRSQYIVAVDKIRGDMLRYIQESRERAAEMLKAEVLRERQETARKMRKYYLICLQQLLKDDGKHEGAEKKIMNAASKLATMAKVLETPISHKSHGRHPRATRTQNVDLPARVFQGRNCDEVQTHPSQGDSRSKYQNISKTNNDQTKYIPHSLDQKFKDGMATEVQSMPYKEVTLQARNEKIMKGLVSGFILDEDGKERPDNVEKSAQKCPVSSTGATTFQNPTSCIAQVKLKNRNAYNWIDGLSDSESDHVPFQIQTKQPDLKGFAPNHPKAYARATSERSPRFDIQETPVRDESCPNDWSLLNENVKLDSNALARLNPVQKESAVKSANTQAQSCSPFGQFSAVGLPSTKDESVDMFGMQIRSQNHPGHLAKRKATNWKKEHFTEIAGHQNCNNLGTDSTKISNFNQNSDFARAFLPHSRKLLLDAGTVQQDSGFDSPLTNITS